VTLLSWDGATDLDLAQRADLSRSGIAVIDDAVASARTLDGGIVLTTDGAELAFDAVYSALGATVASRIAQDLGAQVDADGYVGVDEHQRTDVPGLYAVGDVVAGLHQISRATGQAATAATALRNDLFAGFPRHRFAGSDQR
jgi:thioredoxin reductase (NADPH)